MSLKFSMWMLIYLSVAVSLLRPWYPPQVAVIRLLSVEPLLPERPLLLERPLLQEQPLARPRTFVVDFPAQYPHSWHRASGSTNAASTGTGTTSKATSTGTSASAAASASGTSNAGSHSGVTYGFAGLVGLIGAALL